jgi:hypothetical protein
MNQELLNWIFGGVMTLLGWLGRTLWDAVDNLKKDVKEIEVSLPSHYVRKEDWKDSLDRIETMVNRILEKLDGKVDK